LLPNPVAQMIEVIPATLRSNSRIGVDALAFLDWG
jgi:hypothetical protein